MLNNGLRGMISNWYIILNVRVKGREWLIGISWGISLQQVRESTS